MLIGCLFYFFPMIVLCYRHKGISLLLFYFQFVENAVHKKWLSFPIFCTIFSIYYHFKREKIKKQNKKCLLESIRPNPVINLVLFLRKENYLFFLDHFSKLPERRLRDFCSFFVSVCNDIIVQKFSFALRLASNRIMLIIGVKLISNEHVKKLRFRPPVRGENPVLDKMSLL